MNIENEVSEYIQVNNSFLCDLKKRIEALDDYHLDVFKIILKHELKYSENKNGIFINLTCITPEIIKEIDEFLSGVERTSLYTSEQI